MTRDTSRLFQFPFFVVMIPIFFVIHGYFENYEFINIMSALSLAAFYCCSAVALFFLVFLLNRNIKKVGLLTGLLLMFFFFFGYAYDFFRSSSMLKPLGRYIFLLPFFSIILVILFKIIAKTEKRLVRFTVYLNLLFILFIIVDGIGIGFEKAGKDLSGSLKISNSGISYSSCDSCDKPDIFFLVFDEYESPTSLKERFNFNSDIDSFLGRNGFAIQKYSRANYHFTPFSIASILNMSYVSGIRNKNAVAIEDYASCNALIADSEVQRFLQKLGYQVLNYSIFDLKGNPSMIKESFLPVKTKLISDRTLFSKMRRDLEWMLIIRFSFFLHIYHENFFINNNKFLKLTKDASLPVPGQPRFIYTHLNIPHQPYFMDKEGRRRSNDEIYARKGKNDSKLYLEYVQYANTEIKEIVNRIRYNNPSAVIVLMGDHGYRFRRNSQASQSFLFRNFNAVYIPNTNCTPFSDSITGVNQFRAIFNTVFKQRIPLLEDSVIFLKDKNTQ